MRSGAFALLMILLGTQQLARSAEKAELIVARSTLDESIQRWISDWDQPSFSVRDAASRQLRDTGSRAFPALIEAAQRGKQETVSRALALLKSSLYTDEKSIKESARTSLDQIASGPNPSAARSARQILKDFDHPPSRIAIAHVNAPNVQLQFGGFGPQGLNIAQRINTWTFNGSTNLEAFENDVRIKIQNDVNGRIKVELTQKRQGIEATSKYEAANLAELKRKHPAAYQAYQKYEPALQQAKMIAQRMGGQPRGLPAMAPNLPGRELPVMPNPPKLGNARARTLQLYDAQIEALQRKIPQAPSREIADSLNRNLQRNIEVRDQLRRELGQNR